MAGASSSYTGLEARIYPINLGWSEYKIGIIRVIDGILQPVQVAAINESLGDKGIVAGCPSHVDPCQALLSLLYMLEDEASGSTRIRNRAIRWIAAIQGYRQAREVIEFVREVREILVVGLKADTEILVNEVLGLLGVKRETPISVEPLYTCDPASLAEVTLKRINNI